MLTLLPKRLNLRYPILFAVLAMAMPAQAISIRHDVAESAYFSLAAPYDAVGRIGGPTSFASGTLVSPTKFLTAAHFIDNNRDGVVDGGLTDYVIDFGTNTVSPTYSLSSFASIDIHPSWATPPSGSAGQSTYDLAVLTLSTPFTDITPILLSDRDIAVGTNATMVGYGVHGDGLNFNNSFDERRRAATNTIDVVGSTLRFDFDSPAGDTNEFGSATPLALEGATAGGDSGGPLLVNFGDGPRLVGTLRGGFNNFGDFSEYGDVSIYAPINTESNIAFLESVGVAVPEPTSLAVLLGGLSLVLRRRRG